MIFYYLDLKMAFKTWFEIFEIENNTTW
jgi:hypothetical protein